MRNFKIVSSYSETTFEKRLAELIKQYPDAIVDYKPVLMGNSSVTYTALVEYQTKDDRVIPNVDLNK